ncbi:MAG: tyrosine-type recombinase/integrase [Syntrophomonadaceae bacterium]|nr:tyrosine-type recombinase/integrase [Syntrophomonadaceae bacterium]
MAIRNFYQQKTFEDVSEKTMENYEELFKQFQKYCSDDQIIDVADITSNVIKGFLLYCRDERGNKPGSLDFKLRILKTFFNFLVEENVIKESPAKKIKYQNRKPEIQVFNDQQVDAMLNYFASFKLQLNTFFGYRDYTIFKTLLLSGLRLGEISNLQWVKIDFKEGEMRVFGKQRKEVKVFINEELENVLLDYQTVVEQKFKKLPEYVFINRKGERLGENGVAQVFKRVKKHMIEDPKTKRIFKNMPRISPHTARHYFCSKAVTSQNYNVFEIQQLMRHKSIQTTQRYVHIFENDLKDKFKKFNPLG